MTDVTAGSHTKRIRIFNYNGRGTFLVSLQSDGEKAVQKVIEF